MADIFLCHLEDGFNLADARVSYHDVQRTKILDSGFDEGFDFGTLGDVCCVSVCLSAESLDFFDCLNFNQYMKIPRMGSTELGVRQNLGKTNNACLINSGLVEC